MADTTIGVSEEVKALIDDEKQPDESYNGTLKRLVGEQEGTVWTEQEIRDLARDEMEQAVRSGGLR